MIKNRESAARSRARKQAYTNELELEIAHLQTENARLKIQQEQLKIAEATQNQVKKTLQRSSTAPF
jgi:Tfp pilus assembly protein PilN